MSKDKMKFQDAFRKIIAEYDPVANSKTTHENVVVKMLADWGRHACDKLDEADTASGESES